MQAAVAAWEAWASTARVTTEAVMRLGSTTMVWQGRGRPATRGASTCMQAGRTPETMDIAV